MAVKFSDFRHNYKRRALNIPDALHNPENDPQKIIAQSHRHFLIIKKSHLKNSIFPSTLTVGTRKTEKSNFLFLNFSHDIAKKRTSIKTLLICEEKNSSNIINFSPLSLPTQFQFISIIKLI
jgi:hypothetical protein